MYEEGPGTYASEGLPKAGDGIDIILPYAKHLDIALEAADAAASVLLEMKNHPGRLPDKGDGTMLSEADYAAEKVINEIIQSHFPGGVLKGHEVLSEEKTLNCKSKQWIIDPLDGTRNYLDSNGPWGTMIAFAVNNEVQVGVINLPEEKITISAVRGGGVRMNGKTLNQPLLAAPESMQVYYDTYADRYVDDAMHDISLHLGKFQKFTESRCSAESFFKLITGEVGVLIEYLSTPWDDSAGALFVHELGGHVLDFDGKVWTPEMGLVSSQKESIGKDDKGQYWGLKTRGLLASFSEEAIKTFIDSHE